MAEIELRALKRSPCVLATSYPIDISREIFQSVDFIGKLNISIDRSV